MHYLSNNKKCYFKQLFLNYYLNKFRSNLQWEKFFVVLILRYIIFKCINLNILTFHLYICIYKIIYIQNIQKNSETLKIFSIHQRKKFL